MRYLSGVVTSLPIFLAAVIWGAMGLGILWLTVVALAAVAVGIIVGRYMGRVMEGNILRGERHFLLESAPGGIWFFLGIGVLGGIVAGATFSVVGPTYASVVLRVGALAGGALCCAWFCTSAFAVWRLERAQGQRVYMGPLGLFFGP